MTSIAVVVVVIVAHAIAAGFAIPATLVVAALFFPEANATNLVAELPRH